MRRRYLRLRGALTVTLVLLAIARPGGAAPAGASPADYVADEVIVKLKPLASVLNLVAAFGLSPIVRTFDRLGDAPIYRLKIVDGLSPPLKAAALALSPLVDYAEPNYIGQVPEGVYVSSWSKGGDDPGAYLGQWAPDTVRLPEALAVSRGAGVVVAVLDTGVDRAHPALRGHLIQGFDFVDLDTDPSEEGAYKRDAAFGHGTHVSGLIALTAPDAKIMPLRILKPDGTGDSWLLAQAIRYAVDQGARVINISYAVSHRSALIDDLLGQVTSVLPGAVIAAAAGNSASSTRMYPAGEDTPGLLAVGASTFSDRLASFSNYGAWVDVAAPGEGIVSTVPLSSGFAYAAWSGTSMATPLVAGTAALVRAARPGISAANTTALLASSAAEITGPVPRRLDAAAALGSAP